MEARVVRLKRKVTGEAHAQEPWISVAWGFLNSTVVAFRTAI